MQNFKKTLLTSALIIVSIFAQAQSINTYSPYTRYGVGQISTRGFAGTKAMGGVSQAVRNSFGINYLNPASYSAQDTMSFILDFGFETGATKYQQFIPDENGVLRNESVKNGFGGIHHIAIAFPITRWWGSSLGLVPYSQVGYQIKRYETDLIILSTIGRVKYYNKGSGGINQAFFGNAFKPIKNLSLGFNLSYFFGSLDYTNSVIYPSTGSAYANTVEKNSVIIKDLTLSLGAQYTLFLNEKDRSLLIFGATIDNESKINAKQKYLARWELGNYSDTISFKDTSYGHVTFPKNLSFGVSYSLKNKLFTSIEFSTQDWSNTRFFGGNNANISYARSNSYRFGLEYTPNRYDLKSYLKRISYRFGSHLTNTYLKVNNHQINELALSAGMGFPFKNNTKFNVAFEWGKRGTTNYGLIQENYGVLSLSFTFYDFWFIKRKFN